MEKKFKMYGVGTITSQGVVLDEVEDQIYNGKHWIHKSFIKENEEISDDDLYIQIKNILINEKGNKNTTLYHGTDEESFNKIKESNLFGHSGISFLTLNKLEAKEYSLNKAKYRNIKKGKILSLTLPSWSYNYNNATNEFETPYIFKFSNGVWTPTKESLLRVEKDNLLKKETSQDDIKLHPTLLEALKENFCLKDSDYHNIKHWNRVYKISKFISSHYNIESDIFKYFALFHDVGRKDDDHNFEHGEDGRKLAIKYRKYIDLNDDEFEKLIYACKWHTKPLDINNKLYKDKIVTICWDSDKLDLVRLNIQINNDKLFNKFSKSTEALNFAKTLFKNDDFDIDNDLNFKSQLGTIEINLNDFKNDINNKSQINNRNKRHNILNNNELNMF